MAVRHPRRGQFERALVILLGLPCLRRGTTRGLRLTREPNRRSLTNKCAIGI
jgi:hypothetical protein